ncbi:uncharacterized protein LOC116174154 [Photinus pyralis]|uniref:uncharacterized protein LOC116174154 n=1 Tax=Photinus pyralis TaxID=7054 RepID=UPI001267171C|nr:uncharacterized protein LOC116174154 [Photinus pyralis]
MRYLVFVVCVALQIINSESQQLPGNGTNTRDENENTTDAIRFLVGVLRCLLGSVRDIAVQDLPPIVTALGSALSRLNLCTDVPIVNRDRGELIQLLRCLIDRLGTVSREDLVKIVRELDPILNKLSVGLSCVQHRLNSLCGTGSRCVLQLLGLSCTTLSLLEVVNAILSGTVRLVCSLNLV